MRKLKQIKKDNLKQWQTKMNKAASTAYHLKLAKLETLDKLSMEQLNAVLRLIAASYSMGCNDTREWFKDNKKRKVK